MIENHLYSLVTVVKYKLLPCLLAIFLTGCDRTEVTLSFTPEMASFSNEFDFDPLRGPVKDFTQTLMDEQGEVTKRVSGTLSEEGCFDSLELLDLENNTVEVMRRDTLEKETRTCDGIVDYVKTLLDEIQDNIFAKAKAYRDAHIYECDNYEEFKERVKDGGFFLCHWDGTAETEAKIKEDTQATIRCVPFEFEQTPGVDMVSGKPATCRVLRARSY